MGQPVRGRTRGCLGNQEKEPLRNPGLDTLFHSAWVASCHDSLSKAYYDRKRVEGKRHIAAVMCLARRRLNVQFAMVKAGAFYEAKTPTAA